MAQFNVKINNFRGGYAPSYWDDDYPTHGNKNMAGKMKNVDLTDPSYLQQGPGLTNLGDEGTSIAVDTVIKGVLKGAYSDSETYGIGGDKVYPIVPPYGLNSPHTIAGTNVEGEDVLKYQGDLYYSYRADEGDNIGKYDGSFDDVWGNNTPADAGYLQSDVPHEMIEGGLEDWFYITNGQFVATYKGDEGADGTLDADSLDLPDNCEAQSISWGMGNAVVTANRSGVTDDSNDVGSIFIWDGVSTNRWEREIRVGGKVGATYVKDGVPYVFWDDPTSDAAKLGIINGTQVKEVATFKGTAPAYYQVSEYKNFLIWASNNKIYAWGAASKQLKSLHFQLADGKHDNIYAVACPYEEVLVSSTDGSSSYSLDAFSGYTADCNWKSLLFDISGWDRHAFIQKVVVNTKDLPSGADFDVRLVNADGTVIDNKTFTSGSKHTMTPNDYAEQLRIELDFTNSVTSDTIEVRNIQMYGKTEN